MPAVDGETADNVELVMRADQAARAYDPRIKEVRASYADELRNILVLGSDGTFAEDSQPLARLNVGCIAKTDSNSARGSARGCESSAKVPSRSEEHTSELQSRPHLVCRLLLEKK